MDAAEQRARYGDIETRSAPANPDDPGFDSLLDALRAVHTGELPMDVLVRYHDALGAQLAASRSAILAIEHPPEFRDVAEAQTRIVVGGLDVMGTVLHFLQRYIDEPTADNVGAVVDMLLQAQRVMRDVNTHLDEAAKVVS